MDELLQDIRKYEYRKNIDIPKILLLDIETAPTVAYVWKLFKTNISNNQIVDDWFILVWAAKWLFSDEVISARISGRSAKMKNDKPILRKLHKLLNDADIVVAQNGDRFDIPSINTRFLVQGIDPPMPYQTIDTLKVLRKTFRFSSNRQDFVNRQLGLPRKVDTGGFDLWSKCYNGDNEALEHMETYCRGDIHGLEELYLKLRPWIKGHPNAGLYVEADRPICPKCGSEKLNFKGYYYTTVSKFQAFRCECGAVGRMRLNAMDKDKRKQLVRD